MDKRRNVCIYLFAGMDEMLSLDGLLACRWTPPVALGGWMGFFETFF